MRVPKRPPPVALAGFTLVELLVAMVLTGFVGIVASRLFVAQHQAFVRQGEGIRRTQNARAGFDLMIREMRNAGYDPRGTAGAGLTAYAPASIAWTADLNADGDAEDAGEAIGYRRAEDGTLLRREGGAEVPVAGHVTELAFAYFADAAGATPATTAEEIVAVEVRLEYETPPGAAGSSLGTRVILRNQAWR